MTSVIEPRLAALADQMIGRRRDALAQQVPERDRAIERRHAAAGTVFTPNCFGEIKAAVRDGFSQFANGITSDLLDIVRKPDGSTPPQAGAWVREQIEGRLDTELRSVIDA